MTIGNFDGLHLGHQALLERLCEEGVRRALPVVVMLFEPQPQEFFAAAQAPARLMRLRDKLRYLSETGVDVVLCVPFNQRFASLDVQAFIHDILVEKLGAVLVVVGDDFRFGAGRFGDFSRLQQAGEEYGFNVISVQTFCAGGQRVSSTAIRRALVEDNLSLARKLLGRPFCISGRVIHGDARGRTIGFPTANIALADIVLSVRGVYAVEVCSADKDKTILEKPCFGVANVGTRPTVSGRLQLLEVHLLDMSVDLYGCHINVVFRQKIRNEQRFESLDVLKRQIAKDVLAARHFFGFKYA